MKKFVLAAAMAATSMTGIAYASAQDTPPAPAKKHYGPDANHDGVVTRDEAIAAADARFARMDKNGDGQLSGDELKMRGHHRRGHHRMNPARKQAMMAKFDTNKDGQLSDSEKQAARAAWQAKRAERQAKHADNPDWAKRRAAKMQARIARLDTDGNGSISQAEFRAAAMKRFDMADTNHDGTIDKAEHDAVRAKMKARWEARKQARGATPTAPAN